MKKLFIIITMAHLALISAAFAQNPIDALAGSLQEQMNDASEQLQQKTAQHIAEGNLTPEHISQDLNATTENFTENAKQKLEQKINQQPGFPAALAVLIILLVACLIKKRN